MRRRLPIADELMGVFDDIASRPDATDAEAARTDARTIIGMMIGRGCMFCEYAKVLTASSTGSANAVYVLASSTVITPMTTPARRKGLLFM